jgi:hypothetical protein
VDPRGVGSVSIELNNTAAQLLASLCVELGSDDPTGVLSRALGVLDLCLRSQRGGGRVCVINDRGEAADVVF